jgi:hypothetical protein
MRPTVFAVFNFSAQAQDVRFRDRLYHGDYVDYFSGARTQLDADTALALPAWSYRVFVARR